MLQKKGGVEVKLLIQYVNDEIGIEVDQENGCVYLIWIINYYISMFVKDKDYKNNFLVMLEENEVFYMGMNEEKC